MKLSLSEVFVSNIIVTMVISNKSCCKHVLFTNLSDFISTTTRVTSLKSKKFLFCSFSVAKSGIAPKLLSHHHKPHLLNRLLPPLTLTSSSSSLTVKSLIISSKVNAKSLVLQVRSMLALIAWVEARCCKVIDVSGVGGEKKYILFY